MKGNQHGAFRKDPLWKTRGSRHYYNNHRIRGKTRRARKKQSKKSVETIHSYGIPKAGLVSLTSKPPMCPGAHETLGPEEILSIAEEISRLNIPDASFKPKRALQKTL
ncbi:MAG: hypothetical protein N3F10_07670 [Candidatus Bathyarchaeota archaeon]|nr:hypothetical protein [Candidatus Bathyarchaeota archaeon]